MALDLAPHGIRVNTFCPTFVRPPMTAPFFNNPDFPRSRPHPARPPRRGRGPDGRILFLVSNASAPMTGTSVTVDGGWKAI
jgi:NAD(P)-dependent dehydrogenase (short-subunit alcohol dehydrogenase family)